MFEQTLNDIDFNKLSISVNRKIDKNHYLEKI